MSDRSSIDEIANATKRRKSIDEFAAYLSCLSYRKRRAYPEAVQSSSSSSMLHILSRIRDPFEDPTKFALPRCFRLLKVYDFGSLHLSFLS